MVVDDGPLHLIRQAESHATPHSKMKKHMRAAHIGMAYCRKAAARTQCLPRLPRPAYAIRLLPLHAMQPGPGIVQQGCQQESRAWAHRSSTAAVDQKSREAHHGIRHDGLPPRRLAL